MRRHKFNAKPAEADGIKFASTKERDRYLQLRLLQKAGEISHLEIQPRFKLFCGKTPVVYDSGRQAEYRADFAYFNGKCRVVEDVKSPATKTPLYKLKKALVQAAYPVVQIVEI